MTCEPHLAKLKKKKQNKTHDGPSCDILQTSSDDDDGGGIKIQYMNE